MTEVKCITFSDVLLKPQYSEVESRDLVSIKSNMGPFSLKVPVFSANMRDITEKEMCMELEKHGGMGILHRFMSIEDNVSMFSDVVESIKYHRGFNTYGENLPEYSVGVSIGVKEEDKYRFKSLYDAGARIFCIDIAHGHCSMMRDMIYWIRETTEHKQCPYIIAGNIATSEAALDLANWGADCVKVGIGPGEMCFTRKNTGSGVPQLAAIMDVKYALMSSNVRRNNCIKIISDGGIKEVGDIAKALKYADAVMVGSMFAGTTETPGNVYEGVDGKFYKTYGGSASGENKVKSGGKNRFVEGAVKTVPFRGRVKYIVRKIEEGLKSSFSYSGAFDMEQFKEKAILFQISSGGKSESKI